MIRVTFLFHSGFLVELPEQTLLFDWWKGELPPLADKPLFCFASHRHPDHFDPRIFSLASGGRDVTFLLGKDIRLTPRNREKWGVDDALAGRCLRVSGGQRLETGGLSVEALPSTDEGVAFLVSAGGRTIYHAGDLNWWHWEGEDPAWNRSMEAAFKRAVEPLRGRHIDLAFAPLDPRLGKESGWGFAYLLDTADAPVVFPMHQWEEFGLTARFCAARPDLAERITAVERPGQCWELPL
jgi:L-ascorbate metabolism protein UlaG (beta-lactamase superfamily)